MLRVDSVEDLLGVRAPFAYPLCAPIACLVFLLVVCVGSAAVLAGLTSVFGYTSMHNFAAARSRQCEFAHLCSGGVRLLFEVRAWLHF